jgi:endonuclease-3
MARKAKTSLTARSDKTQAAKDASIRKAKTPVADATPKARKSRTDKSTQIRNIFSALAKSNPEPKGELEHVNPYTLLVAVVLSAQATDASVNKATRGLFAIADTPQAMLALGEDKVRDAIKTIGLFRNKAKNVIALSERLIADHGGEVPADRDALVALPGVGRKTANVVLNMAFGQKTMAVDTHVYRVSHRLAFSKGKTPEAVEDDLMRIVPDDFLYHAHHWLILHGRYTCLARKPRCTVCVIAQYCASADKALDD